MSRTANNPKRLPDEVDYLFEHDETHWLVTPINPAAEEHLVDMCQDGEWRESVLVVGERAIDSLAGALEDDGFATRIW